MNFMHIVFQKIVVKFLPFFQIEGSLFIENTEEIFIFTFSIFYAAAVAEKLFSTTSINSSE